MTTMKTYANMLQEMFNDVKANVAGAKAEVCSCEDTIGRVNGELKNSGTRLSAIKSSFSLWNVVKAKIGFKISANVAREAADRLGEYANVVDTISEQQRTLEEAQVSLSKAEDRVEKTENVQQKLEDLMDALGMVTE